MLGWINFGGPAGQIAIMHRELVERRRWIDEPRFLHALNYCMLLPGPEAMQLAIYIGWLMHGLRGAIVAGVGFFLPGVLILLALSWIYVTYGHVGAVSAALAGFKPVVVAIVALAVIRVGRRALKGPLAVILAVVAFCAIQFFSVPFPFIVLGAIACGAVSAMTGRQKEASTTSIVGALGPPTSPGWTAKLLLAWSILWLAPLLVLQLTAAPDSFRSLYLFFTQAAFVTFGGAYAVLAYVNQAAVGDFGWLTAHQAVDGFALAETTPGPLIIVLQFVGFLAGWNHPGPLDPLVAAVIAALLTTYATFLPSFFFILIGAPHVERLRGIRWLDAALAAVTAAVVGVILNLGVVFGRAVLWSPGSGLRVPSLILAAVALLALLRGANVAWVVIGGGLVSLAAYFFGWSLV